MPAIRRRFSADWQHQLAFDRICGADLAAGAPGEAPGSTPRSGYVFVFGGVSNGLIPLVGLENGLTV